MGALIPNEWEIIEVVEFNRLRNMGNATENYYYYYYLQVINKVSTEVVCGAAMYDKII